MTNSKLQGVVDVAAALADPSRVRALLALRRSELCLCQITELLQLAPSTVSKHMSILKQAGLVESRKQGRWMHYRLTNQKPSPLSRAAMKWAAQWASADPQIADDRRRLEAILKLDLEQLCRLQGKRRKCCFSAPATPAAARWPRVLRGSSRAS